jgi:D-aspartate ligase
MALEGPNGRLGPSTALVVSSGLPGLAVTRALGKCGVPVVVAHCAEDDLAANSRYARATLRLPLPEHDGAAFVDALLDLGAAYSGAVLMPTSDEATRDIALRADELAPYYRLACPGQDAVRRTVDKIHTYELAAKLGIPIPDTRAPRSGDEVAGLAGQIEFPCLVKPRESHLFYAHFRSKVAVAHSPDELIAAHDEATAAGLKVMVQELIPGPDNLGVNYNVFRAAGAVRAECTARKVRLSPARFGRPSVVVSDDVPEVVAPARALLDALSFEGFANIEFKLDPRDGKHKLFEVNCRHNVSTLLSVRCGLNFPYMAYRYASCGELPKPVKARTGVYWIHVTGDVFRSVTAAGRADRSLLEIVTPWMHPKVLAAFDRRDPAPFIRAMGHFAATHVGRYAPTR